MRYLLRLTIPFIGIMNYLGQQGFFGSRSLQDVASASGSIATPAGWTFSIWGVIYLGIVAFIIYQFSAHKKQDAILKKIRPYVLINLIGNGLWYAFATIENYIWVSALIICIMRYTLLVVNQLLVKYEKNKRDLRCVTLPMSIYASRLTIATPLNIAWAISDLWGTRAVTSLIAVLFWIALTYGATLYITQKIHRISFLAVTIRALVGVMVAREFDAPLIFWTAGGLMLLTLIIIAYNRNSLRW